MMGASDVGSSPHTRGALTGERRLPIGPGIIPAYAGSTIDEHGASPVRRDHPRIRGEHPRDDPAPGSRQGSSPHTRGALEVGLVESRLRGIIPAYAGSTRVCLVGDHALFGSSPHTRGARECCESDITGGGIIPAYAGSTAPCVTTRSHVLDHPRIRGEHPQLWRRSPRRPGIIPAYAGSTPL